VLGHEFAGEVVEVGSKVDRGRDRLRVRIGQSFGRGLCRVGRAARYRVRGRG
jgi:threonine dehydrogenase-like Zn-dependent dehydrogenase